MISQKVKEQTAFRFDPRMISMMKTRAKALGKSVNSYVTDLISEDLRMSCSLPKIDIPEVFDEDVKEMAGAMRIPSADDLKGDERLERIWML